MRESGKSTKLYEDPDASTVADQEVISHLEKQIKKNPKFELPAGYRMETQKIPKYSYRVPETAKTHMKES